MYDIQNGVPVPSPMRSNRTAPRRRRYPFEQMEVGDFFFVPNRKRNTLGNYVSEVGRELDRKYATRLTYMREVQSQWELCEPDDEGAVLGIGVWRTE